jgi:hypothetical protein
LRLAQIVSKDGGVLASASKRITRQTHSLSSCKPRSGYPEPIRPHSRSAKWFPARAALGRDDNGEHKRSLI